VRRALNKVAAEYKLKGLREPNNQAGKSENYRIFLLGDRSALIDTRVTNRMASRSGWKAGPERVTVPYAKAMRP